MIYSLGMRMMRPYSFQVDLKNTSQPILTLVPQVYTQVVGICTFVKRKIYIVENPNEKNKNKNFFFFFNLALQL